MRNSIYFAILMMISVAALASSNWKQKYVGKIQSTLDVNNVFEGSLIEDDLWMSFVEIDGEKIVFLQKLVGRAGKSRASWAGQRIDFVNLVN